ncbi:MAG: ABC transporter ATP-binding protein, partial [Nostoc sp.]
MVQQAELQETSSIQSTGRVLKSLSTYRWTSLGALASLLLLTIANAITPQLFRWGIDQGIIKQNLQIVL